MYILLYVKICTYSLVGVKEKKTKKRRDSSVIFLSLLSFASSSSSYYDNNKKSYVYMSRRRKSVVSDEDFIKIHPLSLLHLSLYFPFPFSPAQFLQFGAKRNGGG